MYIITNCRGKLFILLILLLAANANIFPQVKINEKVEIKPGPNITNLPGGSTNYYLPCGPFPDNPIQSSDSYIEYWYPTWYGSTKSVGINQNFMPCEPDWPPENQTWDVDFIEGTQYIRVRKYGENTDAGFNLTGLTWADQNQYLIYFDQLKPVDSAFVAYRVHCPQTGCVSVIRYIEVSPHFTLDLGLSSLELNHGGEARLYAEALNQCGTDTPPLPANVTYNAEIMIGNEYGELKDNNTDITGDTLNGMQHADGFLYSLSFLANGISPSNRDSVIIRFSTTDQSIEPVSITIYINPPLLKVSVNPDTVSAGDKAEIIIKKRNADGSLEDFPPEQTFEIGILDGCGLGSIIAGNDTGSYFPNVSQPLYFLADSSSDTGAVKIRVGLVEDVVGVGKAIKKTQIAAKKDQVIENNFAKKIRTKLKSKTISASDKQKMLNNLNSSISPGGGGDYFCFGGDINAFEFSDANVEINNAKVLIILDKTPPYRNDVYITDQPKMPIVICKAKMDNYEKGKVKYRWAYWVTSDLPRRNKNKKGNYYDLCHRISQSVFIGYSYANNEDTTKWTVPFLKDSGYFYFKAIWYKTDNSTQNSAYGCDNFTREYEGGDTVFTGGNVSVKVIAYDSKGKEIDSDSIWVGKLLGRNQNSINIIYDYANENEIKAIIMHESGTKQFETTNNYYPMYEAGWPRYGYPNGYGLMQLDNTPAPVEEQLWNWKSNIDGGKSRFNVSKQVANKYIDDNHATYVDSIFYMNAYQNYNSGIRRYWDWNKRKGIWVDSKNRGSNPLYGKNVYDILKSLNN